MSTRVTATSSPLVTAVMLVGAQERFPLSRVAALCYARQRYAPCELLVVNSTGVEWPWLREFSGAREVRVDAGHVGRLRNAGQAAAWGEWLVQWDDDDWSHPDRVLAQMAHRRDDACVLLRRQGRFDVRGSLGHVPEFPGGAPGTLLWPRGPHLFREQGVYEDRLFVDDHFPSDRRVVLDFPSEPALHSAFWHDRNATPSRAFLKMLPGWLGEVLADYGGALSPDGQTILSGPAA